MEINRNNHEAFLLDLIEGKLDKEGIRQVRDFLLLNPDLGEEMHGLLEWILEADQITYDGKRELKKVLPDRGTGLTDANFDLFSIARMEGDLTPEQERIHARQVEDKQMQDEWRAWQQTRLPREEIRYRGKNLLKHSPVRPGRIIWLGTVAAAAASILLFLLLRTGPVERVTIPSGEMAAAEHTGTLPARHEQPREGDPRENQPKVAESMEEPHAANDTGILSIRKHQDPPELTGRDKEMQDPARGQDGVEKVTAIKEVPLEDQLQPRPVKLALHPEIHMPDPDRIEGQRILSRFTSGTGSRGRNSFLASYSRLGLKQASLEYAKENDISLLTVASAGINGISRVTGSERSVEVTRDENGKASGFRFSSSLLSFSVPVKKAE